MPAAQTLGKVHQVIMPYKPQRTGPGYYGV